MDRDHGTLPNLIIIGAQKCGTTSLHYYLRLHPQVAMAREKELDFFIQERNWSKGIAWYASQFTGRAVVRGEASPGYTYHPFFEGVPERMQEVIPGTKLIYIVGDPIERIVSAYVHARARGVEHRPFKEALWNLETNPYVFRSQYYRQLERYLRHFPQSQMLIVTKEDLHHRRRQVLRRVFGFLGIDPTFQSVRFVRKKHPSKLKRRLTPRGRRLTQTPMMRAIEGWPYRLREKVKALAYWPFSHPVPKPELSEALRLALTGYLSDDVERLRACTGHDLAEWSL